MSKGLDVSQCQGTIDWKKIKASGVDFVIIRAGWGKNGRDSKFKENIESAISVGLNIGIYWFLYGKSEKDIIGNANSCISVIGAYKDNINMKVWADWEYDSDNYCKGLTKATRTQWVKAFCKQLKDKGFDVGIYANPDYINNKFNDISDYPLWLAFYNANPNSAKKYNPLIWQYTSKGTINGIKGYVDLDEFYGKIESKPIVIEQPKQNTNTNIIKHTVKKGEYLTTIANKYKITVDAIMAINPQIKNKNLINVGQVINVPTTTTTATNPYKEPILTQKFGSVGDGVKWIQWALNNKGNYNLVIDGKFGTNTEKAVIDFQNKNESICGKADGKVGVKTRKALK